jgi:hypothetical protein
MVLLYHDTHTNKIAGDSVVEMIISQWLSCVFDMRISMVPRYYETFTIEIS